MAPYHVGGNWTSRCSLIEDPSSYDCIDFCENILDHHCDPGRKAWNTAMGPLRDTRFSTSAGSVHRGLTLQGYHAELDFHPLGMEIHPSHDNTVLVNHARAETTIEQSVLDPARLTEARYVCTLPSAYFASPNAVDEPDEFLREQ